jgi:MFS family permease
MIQTKSPSIATENRFRAYLILALVAFGVFIAADDLTVISTMLPQMIFDFEIPLPSGLDDASWIVSSYLITHVVAMPLLGRISDVYGRRFLFISCMLIFAGGSLMVAQATTLRFLIFSRVVQAIGGGGVVPVARPMGLQLVRARREGRLQLIASRTDSGPSTLFPQFPPRPACRHRFRR